MFPLAIPHTPYITTFRGTEYIKHKTTLESINDQYILQQYFLLWKTISDKVLRLTSGLICKYMSLSIYLEIRIKLFAKESLDLYDGISFSMLENVKFKAHIKVLHHNQHWMRITMLTSPTWPQINKGTSNLHGPKKNYPIHISLF